MWRFRPKSPVQVHHSSPTFACSSFKDIQTLCSDNESSPDPQRPYPRTPTVFRRLRLASSVLRALSANAKPPPLLPEPNASPSPLGDGEAQQSEPSISIPGAEKRVVVYFTSLRVVRSTFEDCKTVRSILRGFRVSIDERDLSMDSSFMEELRKIMGQPEKSKLTLPRVFIGGRYVGGAEEIRQLHEVGELKRMVEGLPAAEPGTCEACGGYRFILCDECSGSHKCYSEKIGFRSCTACNENGLIRCPTCYYAPF